jgi:hypothetical protein
LLVERKLKCFSSQQKGLNRTNSQPYTRRFTMGPASSTPIAQKCYSYLSLMVRLAQLPFGKKYTTIMKNALERRCEHTRILGALVKHPQGNLEEIQQKPCRAPKKNLEIVRTARPGRTPLHAPKRTAPSAIYSSQVVLRDTSLRYVTQRHVT